MLIPAAPLSAGPGPGLTSPHLGSRSPGPSVGDPSPLMPVDAVDADFPPGQGVSLTGDIRIHRDFPSRFLEHRRDVTVYLPPGYHEYPEKRYPVLYVHDGQNLFDRGTSAFGTEWGVDEAAEHLIREGSLKDVIIVGVANTPDRMGEYTPCPDPKHGGGKAASYGRFMVEELKPYVDAHFRTSPSSHDTGVMGSSLGGLCSLYLGWKYPDVFGLVAALSPSLWWGNRAMLEALASTQPGRGPERIWVDMGTAESPADSDHNGVPDTLDNTRALGNILVGKGYRPEENLFYREIPGAAHNEAAWADRMEPVLQTLFGPPEDASPSQLRG